MSRLRLSHPSRKLHARVQVPASKSESNRLLILQALAGRSLSISNLSTARDTALLSRLLSEPSPLADVNDAGTAMRFLTACFAALNKEVMVTGSARMQQRPIGPLVTALSEIGFDVRYAGEEGYPPVQIVPLKSFAHLDNEVHISAQQSSQFVTALLLIAAFLPNGLTVHLQGAVSSAPYIEMTLQLLQHFGIAHSRQQQSITIAPGKIHDNPYTVGGDWSAASYWYAMAFLADEAEIFIEHLRDDWTQGDRIMADWMKRFGVETAFSAEGATLRKKAVNYPRMMKMNFSDNPDLAQTFAAMFAAANVYATFSGIESLRIKETDRIAALQSELAKAGVQFSFSEMYDFYQLKGTFQPPAEPVATYNDHRMAMAFATWSLLAPVTIQQPEVVEKSYPAFWSELQKAGFEVKEV